MKGERLRATIKLSNSRWTNEVNSLQCLYILGAQGSTPGLFINPGPSHPSSNIPSSPRGTVGADKQGKSTISLKEQLGKIQGIHDLRPNDGAELPPSRPQLQFLINR